MSVTYIETPSAASPPLATDDGNTMYLVSRLLSRQGATRATVDTWEGSKAAADEMYEDYKNHALVSSITTAQNGGKKSVTLTWPVEFTDGAFPGEGDVDESGDVWSMSFIEVPTPLVAHEYFQTAYVEGSGEIIEDEIARCESALKRGRSYVASGEYKEYVSRYYALRVAGVEEYMQFGVELRRTFTSTDVNEITAIPATMGQVVAIANIGAPAAMVSVINAITRIANYTTSDPSTVQFENAAFEFLHRPPDLTLEGDDVEPKWSSVDSWWGLAKWSKVIYPGGTWDPQGEMVE